MNSRYIADIRRVLHSIPVLYGVDPGGSTGLVRLERGIIDFIHTISLNEVYDIAASGSSIKKGLWIIEDFKVYPWVADKLAFDTIPAARAIGAFESVIRRSGGSSVYQNASEAKDTTRDCLIREVVVGVPARATKHEMDALRHVVHYASRQLARLDTRPRRGV